VVNPTERHWEIFRNLVVKGQAQSSLISDARLATLAIEHGAILATTDRDFTRFPGLRILNPLEA
jgi:predicted nucleic acid-binding protein